MPGSWVGWNGDIVVVFLGKIAYNVFKNDIVKFLLLEFLVGTKTRNFSGIGKGCDWDEQYFKYGKPLLQSDCQWK